jgi:TIGR03009 family protein
MRTFGPALLAFTVSIVGGSAQDPKAQPARPTPTPALSEKNQKYLDAYLGVWEDRMKKIDALETKIVLTEVEAGPPQVKTQFTGDASLLKPNYAKLFLKEASAPTNAKKWRHFVADGEFLWDYDYGKKIARVLQLPKNGIGDIPVMTFLFGMKAAEIKARYDLSIDVDNPDKHNDFYLHIGISPKSPADMQEFKKAELVLWKNNKDPKFADFWMLPARLWFQHPNGNQITWEFKNLSTTGKLMKGDFKAPGFPDKEWKSEWVKPPTPTVSRVAGPKK